MNDIQLSKKIKKSKKIENKLKYEGDQTPPNIDRDKTKNGRKKTIFF